MAFKNPLEQSPAPTPAPLPGPGVPPGSGFSLASSLPRCLPTPAANLRHPTQAGKFLVLGTEMSRQWALECVVAALAWWASLQEQQDACGSGRCGGCITAPTSSWHFREEEEPPGQVLGHSAACIRGVKCDFGPSAPGPGPAAQQLWPSPMQSLSQYPALHPETTRTGQYTHSNSIPDPGHLQSHLALQPQFSGL